MSVKNETGEALCLFCTDLLTVQSSDLLAQTIQNARFYNTSNPLSVRIFIQRESLTVVLFTLKT